MTIPNDTRFDDLKTAARRLGGQDGTGQLARIELGWRVLDAARDGVIDPFAKLGKGEDSPVTVLTLTYYAAQAAKLDGVEGDRKPAIKQMAGKLNTFAKMGAAKAFDGKAVLLAAAKVMKAAGVSPHLENLVKFNTAQYAAAAPLSDAEILALFLKAAPAPAEPAEDAAPAPAPDKVPEDDEVAALTAALAALKRARKSNARTTAIAVISARIEELTAPRSEMVSKAKAEEAAATEATVAAKVKEARDVGTLEGRSDGIAMGMEYGRANTLRSLARAKAVRPEDRPVMPTNAPTSELDALFNDLVADTCAMAATAMGKPAAYIDEAPVF